MNAIFESIYNFIIIAEPLTRLQQMGLNVDQSSNECV